MERPPPGDPGVRGGSGLGAAGVEVTDPGRRLDAGALAWLRERAAAAMVALEAGGEARVRVVDDAAMGAAHERYSGVTGTTDVLTFDYTESGSAVSRVLDVDILICVDEAARQADTRGLTAERELLLYIVHAALHCLGHDDHEPADAAAMHRVEDEVLQAIGVGRTFAASCGDVGAGGEDRRGEEGARAGGMGGRPA